MLKEIFQGDIRVAFQKTPLETKSLDPKSRTIRSFLGASRLLKPCATKNLDLNNNYLYFKHNFQLYDLVHSDWDRTHHFWSFLRLAVGCLKRVQ